jgi:hypothetical protein
MMPPVATRRIVPRSSFVRRRSRPGTMPWGRSPRRASRSRWRASRGVRSRSVGGRSADAGDSPDSEAVTSEGYRDQPRKSHSEASAPSDAPTYRANSSPTATEMVAT